MSTAADPTNPALGKQTGTESSLSSWAGPYVTNMLGMGQALAQTPYQAYTGPLTAGYTAPQQQAFSGIAGLTVPTEQMGAFTPTSFTAQGTAEQYMSPFLQGALEPQIAEARRQAEISRLQDAARLSKAGAFGGSRQAIMESEGQRNLLRNLADITGRGYQQAFTQAQQQFNVEQGRQQAAQELANRYGLEALGAQAALGAQERAIEQQAVDAARQQFEEEKLFPYKQVQFMQSLLQDLPLGTQQYSYQQPSGIQQLLGGTGELMSFIQNLFKASPTPASTASTLDMNTLIGNTSPDAGTVNPGAGMSTGVDMSGTVADQILGTSNPAAGNININAGTGQESPPAGTINLGI